MIKNRLAKNAKWLVLVAALALALTPVLAQLEDLGNLVGIRVEGTDATSSTGLPIYDKYAQFFDFLIFTGIFVAIVYIGLSKFWGEDIKQGGAGRAVRALAIIVGAAMAIAVIRAGLSVSFFIPFAKNLLFFLVIIALYFLFQRMGIKSKFLSLILAVIVAVILFNVGSIFFTGKKLSLPSFGKETFKVPDFGGPTIVSSKVAEKISEATGGKAVKGDGLTADQKAQLEKDIIELEKELGIYKDRARIECRAPIINDDSYADALKKLRQVNSDLSAWLSNSRTPDYENAPANRDFLTRCQVLEKEFSDAYAVYVKKLKDLGKTPPVTVYSEATIDARLKQIAEGAAQECKFIVLRKTDTFDTLLKKLSDGTLKYRENANNLEPGPTQSKEYEMVGKCEAWMSELDQILIDWPDKRNDAIGVDSPDMGAETSLATLNPGEKECYTSDERRYIKSLPMQTQFEILLDLRSGSCSAQGYRNFK
ncbi:hypothetical protein J4227_01345 [Candidatus Woesearchaeota archaeon]|nr:hypothetical protein [Candidatus Woesearchaeota archaeon]